MPARALFIATLSILLLAASQSYAQSATTTSPHGPSAATAADNSNDLAAMKDDLAKMRVLVTQLQNNLGLTTNSTTPLYHQFDLEIQMWQLLLAQMDRRLQRMEQAKTPGKRE